MFLKLNLMLLYLHLHHHPARGALHLNRPVWLIIWEIALLADTVGLNDNQFGPVAFVVDATLLAPVVVELSFCSQQ